MKKLLKKSLAFILALTMVFGAAPLAGLVGLELPEFTNMFSLHAKAAYENTYTNTGNQRVDIVEVAKTQIGNTNGLKYRSDGASWCAAFVVWCARQAGIGSSIIKNTGWATADDLGVSWRGRNADRTVGIDYTPKSGDLIIFDWSSNGYCYKSPASSYGDHVGIVEYVSNGYVHTIEGNSGSPGSVKRQTYSLSSSEIKGYGVPNYTSEVHVHSYIEEYEAAHPHKKYMKCNSCGDWYYTGATQYLDDCSDCWDLNRVDVWVTNVDGSEEITEGIVKTKYQFWFKFANKDTGAYYNSYGSVRGYNAKISVYNPDGSELFSYEYADSDYNWIMATPTQLGEYKVRITLSGNITADYWEYFTIKSTVALNFEKSSITLKIPSKETDSFKVWVEGVWPETAKVYYSIDNNIATYSSDYSNFTFTAVGVGTTTFKATIKDTRTGEILTEKSCTIKVIKDQYKLSYDANGGTGAPSYQTGAIQYTISSTKPTKRGNTFLGWSKSSNATSASFNSGNTITLNEDTTLYAVWKPNSYTVSFNANGGSCDTQSKSVQFGSVFGSLPTPVKQGYYFDGWFTSLSGGNKITNSSVYMSAESITLYAHWTEQTFTLTYKSMLSSTVSKLPDSQTGARTYTITSEIPVFTQFGRNFIGWIDEDTYEIYKPGDTITLTKNKSLYENSDLSSISSESSVTTPIIYSGQIYYYKFVPSTSNNYVIYSTGNEDTKVYLYDTNGNVLASNDDGGENRNFRLTYSLTSGTTYYFGISYWSSKTGNISVKLGPTYTINYNANGGSNAPISQTKDWEIDSTLSLSAPTRSGYIFKGWATSSTSATATYQPGATFAVNSNTTLYAVWSQETYTLSYNANGGVGAPPSQTGSTSYSISSTVPTRTGYNFAGWSKNSSATTSSFQPGNTISLTSSTTLYAIWSQSTISSESSVTTPISYNGQIYYYKFSPVKSGNYVIYSTGDEDTKVYLYDSGGNQLASDDDSGDGNNFVLKYNLSYGNTYYFGVKYYSSSKTGTISVKFGPVYSITYNGNGGTEEPSSQFKNWGENINLTSSIPTRNGYSFAGWATSSTSATATYQPGATFTANSNATLYAVWSRDTYMLSYNANGGVGAPPSQTGSTSYTISSTVPTRTGYNFIGWSKSSSATTASYRSGSSVELTSSTTLYAVWKQTTIVAGSSVTTPITYEGQVYYYKYVPSNSGNYVIYSTGDEDTKVYLYDANGNELSLNDDSGENRNFRLTYNFMSGATYYFGICYRGSKTGNISVKLGPTYTINYNANGGSNAPTSQTKDWGIDITLSISVPTRNGYVFKGWATSSTSTTAKYQPGNVLSENANTTLYAIWEKQAEGKHIESISIFTLPKETSYREGSVLNKAGLTIKVNYSDGTYIITDSGFTCDPETLNNEGTQMISVSYGGKTATFIVEVKEEYLTCPKCGELIKDEIEYNKHIMDCKGHDKLSFKIRNPSTSSIDYGDSIILHADFEKLPDGAYIEWSESNGNFDMSVSEDGLICKISPKSSGKTVFTATVYDKDGNIISSDTQEMNAKAGLWQKIVAFFKKIFGLTKTIPEAFKGIF